MSFTNEITEYAIEVPGRGYFATDPSAMGSLQPVIAFGIKNHEYALESLKYAIRRYVSLGCPEIAKTLRIVKRTATLTHSAWEPME